MNKEQGSILIASLWALSLFSILVANVGFQGGQHALLMKRELEGFDKKAHFYNTLYSAGQSITQDPEPHEDSPLDSWYGEITDEESRLNINFAERPWLEAFLKLFEKKTSLKGETKDFIKALLKKRAKGRLLSLEELYLMEGIEKEDVEKLRPFLTVYPELPQVNINTVDPLVLESLIESLPGDSFAKKELFRRIKEHREKIDKDSLLPFRSDELEPPLFMSKLKLTPNLQMVSIVQRLVPFLTTDSRTYWIRMKTETGAAEAVFKERVTEPGIEVLSWHED
jgi:hypothetical protein